MVLYLQFHINNITFHFIVNQQLAAARNINQFLANVLYISIRHAPIAYRLNQTNYEFGYLKDVISAKVQRML